MSSQSDKLGIRTTYNRKILAVIPARAGSKRLPNKNKTLLHGKPLITWTIEAALVADIFTAICVTSDDDEILNISKHHNISAITRPHSLATDEATTIDAVLHALEIMENKQGCFDDIVLLQPTSPLRSHNDIKAALDKYYAHNCCSLCSVVAAEHPIDWYGEITTSDRLILDYRKLKNKRSQDYPAYYRLNGAIYISSVQRLRASKAFFHNEVLAYTMSQENSVDIDVEHDLLKAEFFLGKRLEEA